MATDRVWDEAQRLVTAAIAAVSMATQGMGAGQRSGAGAGGSFATGSPECCVCPVCRVIVAMRDPSADLADRLTTGVSDLATGVASLLRNLAGGAEERRPDEEPTAEGDEFWESLRRRAADEAKQRATHGAASTVANGRSATSAGGRRRSTEDDPWRLATLAPEDDVAEPPAPAPAPRPMAKKMARKAVRPPAPADESAVGESVADEGAGTRRAAAKAARAERAVPPQPELTKGVAKKAVAKKAVAKKAVRKAAASQEEPS
jgi:hypothetical protein